MTDSDTPNKDRAESALSIYRSEMRQYISRLLQREHGPDWMLSTVPSHGSRERSPASPEWQERSSNPGVMPEELIDFADISRLIQDNRHSFDDLRRADIDRMRCIRDLRTELYHSGRAGDCTPSAADAIVGLCGLVLDRCGLVDATESIRQLSSVESESGEKTPATASRKRRLPLLIAHSKQDQSATEPPHGGSPREVADRALLIYRAAMRQHLRSVLQQEYGSDWIRHVLERGMSRRVHRNVVGRRLRMLEDGYNPEELLDVGDFPFVIQENQQLFPDLQPADIDAMRSVAHLRNAIAHGVDRMLYSSERDRIVDLCTQVLERRGLADAAGAVRRLSSDQNQTAESFAPPKRPLLSRIFRG